MSIETLIDHFGLAAVFLGSATEGEVAAATGGFLAHRGVLPLWPVTVAVYAGSLLTGQLLFIVGRSSRSSAWVRRLTARPGYARVLSALAKRPMVFILAYRFIFGARILTPLVVGMSVIPAGRFTALNSLSAALWSIVFTALGYWFGAGIEHVFGRLPSLQHMAVGGGAIALIVGGVWLWRHRAKSPQSDRR